MFLSNKLSFNLNNTYLIRGKNGSGKTTLLRKIRDHYFLREKKIFIDQLPLDIYPQYNFTHLINFLKLEKDFNIEFLLKNLYELNLEKFLKQPFTFLSAGEQQLFKLLLFFSFESSIFFIDEPFNYLDHDHKEYIKKILLQWHQLKTLFITDHTEEIFIHNSIKIALPYLEIHPCSF